MLQPLLRMAVAAAVHSRDQPTVADASVQVLIHETVFFVISLNMSSVSPLVVSIDFAAGSQVDDGPVPRCLGGAGECERHNGPSNTSLMMDLSL